MVRIEGGTIHLFVVLNVKAEEHDVKIQESLEKSSCLLAVGGQDLYRQCAQSIRQKEATTLSFFEQFMIYSKYSYPKGRSI